MDSVQVTDSAEEMLKKIDSYITQAPCILFPRLAGVARQYTSQIIKRGDREFESVMYGMNMHIGEMEAELLMPEALIGDNKERRELRNKINITLQARPHSGIVNPYGCTYADLPAMRDAVIDRATFQALVKDLPSYQALWDANLRIEELLQECERVLARRCARGCGVPAPIIECGDCKKFYCCSSCMDSHIDLKMCTPS